MASRTDPNLLTLLLRGLSLLTRYTKSRRRDDGFKVMGATHRQREGKLLDSLAYSLVEKQGQVIAVGAQLLPRNRCRILIAENGEVLESTQLHFRRLVQELCEIRALYVEGPPNHRTVSPNLYVQSKNLVGMTTDGLEPIDKKLVELEMMVVRHCWDRILYKYEKNGRNKNFKMLADDILGVSADTRKDLTDDERDMLEKLQKDGDSENLRFFITHVCRSTHALDAYLLPQGRMKDINVHHVRNALELIRLVMISTEIQYPDVFWRAANLYIRLRLRNKGTSAHKFPDVHSWISKTVATRTHFIRVANLVASSSLARFVDRPEITFVTTQTSTTQIDISRTKVRSALRASANEQETSDIGLPVSGGYTLEEGQNSSAANNGTRSRGIYGDDYHISSLIEHVKAENGLSMQSEDGHSISVQLGTHCECAVLDACHDEPAIPYVGVSQPPCVFCDLYFQAHRESMHSSFRTSGTRGKITKWLFPSAAPDDVRRTFIKLLQPKLLASYLGWRQRRRGIVVDNSPAMSLDELLRLLSERRAALLSGGPIDCPTAT